MTRMTAQDDHNLIHKLRLIESESRPDARRWKKRPLVSLSEVIVWSTWLIITAAVLLALCMMLTLIWPATP